MAEATLLEPELQQLECHFTWELKKEDLDITDVLNRLEQHEELHLGGKAGLAQTYNSLAFVKYLLGSPTEAISLLHKSMELTRECREDKCDKWLIVTYGNLAWLHHHMKAYSECESYLQKLREIGEKFPTDSPSTLHHEVLGEKAWAFFKFSRKYYERAEECFKKALELEPRDPQWNAGYAFVLHRTERYGSVSSPENSPCVKQLRQAIDADPENDELKALLALKLCTFKQYDEAESLVEKALEGSPSAPNVIRYVGKFLRTYGCVDRSIALLKRVMESSPNSGFLHHQLALCYRKKKISVHRDSPSASSEIPRLRRQCIYHLEKATTLKSCFINAMMELAVQYGEDNQLDRAEEMFQGTLQIAKEKNEFLQQVYVYYGEFQQYRKRCFPLALSYYKECLKMGHDSVDGKRSAKNLTKIAHRYFFKNPQDARAWGILGFINKEKGENREAIKCYERALQFKANDEYLSALFELRLTL
ncbi:interferon-induced protein with tetratricopeptide repeats 5-like [Salminus brasiliensis]|uniref:interferon-induced protein with tetratricopeptide repeats 5-like n=1 Tax=Salminus brasiliensis TaxID=930266 RepID=UPI003B832722